MTGGAATGAGQWVVLPSWARHAVGHSVGEELPSGGAHPAHIAQQSALPALGLDCEFLQVTSGKMVTARCAVVSSGGEVLLDMYVGHDPADVLDYHTRYSGIRQTDVDGTGGSTVTMEDARTAVVARARGHLLVGHSIEGDLNGLDLSEERLLAGGCVGVVDTQALDWGERQTRLAALADELLGTAIQTGEHCPVEDALATVRLWELHRRNGGPPPLPRVCLRVVHGPSSGGLVEELHVEWCPRDVRRALAHVFVSAGHHDLAGDDTDDADRPGSAPSPHAACVEFPASLTKTQRGLVHDIAAELRLSSESRGVGVQRTVQVSRPLGATCGRRERRRGRGKGWKAENNMVRNSPDDIAAVALKVFRRTQEEGGMLARYSRDEVFEAMESHLQGAAALPADLQRVCEELAINLSRLGSGFARTR